MKIFEKTIFTDFRFFHKILTGIILRIYGRLESWESGKSGIGTNLLPKMRQKIVLCPGKTRRRSLKTEFEKFYDVFQKLFLISSKLSQMIF